MTKRQWLVLTISAFALIVTSFVALVVTGALRPSIHIGPWNPTIRIGSVMSQHGDHMHSHYVYFDGHEQSSVDVSDSSSLDLDYSVTVKSGSLEVRVLNSDGEVLWQHEFEEDATGQTELDVLSSDRVQVQVIGHTTKGQFDVSWGAA